MAYQGFYCFDNIWEVNFNGDLCYENAADRVACGDGFNFTKDVEDCIGQVINEAPDCDLIKERFLKYNLPYDTSITLAPRSSCGMSFQAYSSLLKTEHKFPLSVYHTVGDTPISMNDTDKMLGGSDRESKEKGCLVDECTNTF